MSCWMRKNVKQCFAYGTRDVDAYLHLLEGRELLYEWFRGSDNENVWEAMSLFDAAIEADPKFAAAHARRGDVLLQFLDGIIPTPVFAAGRKLHHDH